MNGEDWSDLETEARALGANRFPSCSVAIMLDVVAKEHGQAARDSIVRTLANVRLTSSSIHAALTKRVDADYLPTATTLGRHRAGRCKCPKGES